MLLSEESFEIEDDNPKPIGRVISLLNDKSPSFQQLHIRLQHTTTSLPPGSWVSIEAQTNDWTIRRVLGRIIDTWEYNPHEDPQSSLVNDVLPFDTVYAPEGESTVIYRAAEVELMEEAKLDVSGEVIEITEVTTLPRAGAAVFAANDKTISLALGMEPNSEKGIVLGWLRGSGEPPTSAILKRDVIQRHIFIGGGIGSGKSYCRGVLAEELHALGVPQINIDPNGEMREATTQLGGYNLIPGKNGFTLPLSSLTANDIIDAIPGVRNGTNIETLIAYAHEALLKERTYQRGQHFSVEDLVDKIRQVAPDLHMNAPNTLSPALQRAQSLDRIPYIGKPFDWKTYLKPGAVINIDCQGLLVSDLRLIVASIARDLQRLARNKDNIFVAFSIDEFHLVAPNDDKSVTTQVLREIARIGRHYKIGLILTTQSPQDVDRSILKRLLTRFLFTIESDQLDALRGVFSDASDSLVKGLPKLPTGTCILTGAKETIRHAALVDIRSRITEHGGKTPDIWSDFEEKGWSTKKDLELYKGSDND